MSEIVARLVVETGIRPADIRRIMYTAPVKYKTYQIQKRSGKLRTISQPTPDVKIVQRALARVFLDQLPIHSAATAYRSGISLRENVIPHLEAGPILKMDLRDFFPSIRSQDWVSYCNETGCLTDPEDILLTSHLLFQRPKGSRVMRLAIGAPSSPVVSNLLMMRIDTAIANKVAEDEITYTRYADDMTFSARRTGYLVRTISDVASVLRAHPHPKLAINAEKTTYVTKKYGRYITGLTITNDEKISIGRDRKRSIHAAVHGALHREISKDQSQILAGMLAYVNAVEPEFLETLKRKYGSDAVLGLTKAYYPGHKLGDHRPPLASSD